MILSQSLLALTFFEKIINADHWLMLKINRDWHHPYLDQFSLLIREPLIHVPLYIFLFVFLIMNFGRDGMWWIIAALIMAGINDILSSQIIKEIFDRPRPCRDETIAHQIRFLAKYCGMNGSFISSHASNHFAVAMFIFRTLGFLSKWTALAFVWAAAISLAQVYVGVHFPSDIICGALFGCGIGIAAAKIFNNKIDLVNSAR